MELSLGILLGKDSTFTVYQKFIECIDCKNSILIVDYKYTPWVREKGNLLW